MLIMVLQNVPPALRGKISTYLMETMNGVFVGNLSARVRDKLWELSEKGCKNGAVFQAWSTNNEQGFTMRLVGSDRVIDDWEGLLLVREPARELTKTELKRLS